MTNSSKNWCFTLNNYTPQEVEAINALTGLKYLVYGFEVGESGTPHLQGFAIHTNKVSIGAMKKLIARAHWEMARGRADQAAAYCMKDKNFKEFGERPVTAEQSKKRTWDEMVKLARDGDFDKLIDEYPGMYLRYHKGFKSIHTNFKKPTAMIDTDNYWYYGPTGSGKSTKAFSEYPGAYIKMANKWWCDYAGEDTVIIEDWSPDHYLLFNDLKLWSQRQPTRVESKNGGFMIRPKRIIITSQYTIEECAHRARDADAIIRRFKVVNF